MKLPVAIHFHGLPHSAHAELAIRSNLTSLSHRYPLRASEIHLVKRRTDPDIHAEVLLGVGTRVLAGSSSAAEQGDAILDVFHALGRRLRVESRRAGLRRSVERLELV